MTEREQDEYVWNCEVSRCTAAVLKAFVSPESVGVRQEHGELLNDYIARVRVEQNRALALLERARRSLAAARGES